jgi:hypothetical protein
MHTIMSKVKRDCRCLISQRRDDSQLAEAIMQDFLSALERMKARWDSAGTLDWNTETCKLLVAEVAKYKISVTIFYPQTCYLGFVKFFSHGIMSKEERK